MNMVRNVKKGATRPRQDRSSVVIYHSQEDDCWIAHSLHTDQIGTGERVVDALADLIRGLRGLLDLAKNDPTVQILRRAPDEIFKRARRATTLPPKVYDVACEMVAGEWPDEVKLDVLPGAPKYPSFKTDRELVPA